MSHRLTLITGRTREQGQARYAGRVSTAVGRGQVSRGYEQATAWIEMNPEDMARMGIAEGQVVHVSASAGEADLPVRVGKLPSGVAFVPLGPAASCLSGADTEGTGMPLLKGLTIVITPDGRQSPVEP